MLFRVAIIAYCASSLALAEPLPIKNTAHFDLPANAMLRIEHSVGELRVQGWDRPDAEITITQPANSDPRVTTERRDNELIVTTNFRHHRWFPFGAEGSDLKYDIRVPRTTRLMVKHEIGDVHVDEVLGELHVTDRQGEITVRLPDGQYAMDAKSNVGAVTSDFPGHQRRRLWPAGHTFTQSDSGSAQKLYLRVGYGDIIVFRARRPAMPAAAP